MTIKTSACALVDDFVGSGSWLRTEVSACDFGLLDTSVCGVVIQPAAATFDLIAYGGVEETTWTFSIDGFIVDNGDLEQTATRVYTMIDNMRAVVAGGTCSNNANRTARMVSIDYDPDSVYDLGGLEFRRIQGRAEVKEDP